MRTFALFLLKTDNAKRQLPRYVLSPVTINAPEERFRNNCGEVDEVVHEYASKFTSCSTSTPLNVLISIRTKLDLNMTIKFAIALSDRKVLVKNSCFPFFSYFFTMLH